MKQLLVSVLLMSVLLAFGQSDFRKDSFDKTTLKNINEKFGNIQNKFDSEYSQKLDSIIDSHWDESNSQWIDNTKYEYLYDIHGNLISQTDFNKQYGQWIGITRDEWSYDENGNNIEYIVYSPNDSGELVPSYKAENTFNTSNNIELSMHYYWSSSDEWMPSTKDEYSYDDVTGNNTLVLGYQYEGVTWNYNYKIENTFDGENRLIIHVFYIAEEGGGDFYEYYRDLFTYDENSNVITFIQYWDGSSSPHSKEETIYIDNIVSSGSGYMWNETETDWDIDIKREISYDAEGNPILQNLSFWDGSSWQLNLSYEHSYDISSLLSEITTPQNFIPQIFGNHTNISNYIVNKPLSYLAHHYYSDELSKSTNYYSDFELGIADIPKPGVNIFPNPATEKVYITSLLPLQNSDVKIYTVSGELVLERKLKDNCISINNLSKGIYFMKINIGKMQTIKKLIKN